ncbi:hypothetical protein CFC21_068592 [Triticum aestivum]|uniref:C2H2-type domain-containing protein n=2 Tax=Triticum aestivum TaxID=4565 RepID=A0A3B6KSC3_WHEAT|nr:hypothetical protein CFC21_068592 [Triticum aestivum]
MKRAREEEPVVSLALSLSTDSPTTSSTTSDNSTGVPAAAARKRTRRGRVVSTSGEGEFVCKTCGRAFETFQALGEHRTSHLRGRHGLELGVGVARAIKTGPEPRKATDQKQGHQCHVCGQAFEMGQALGGHMRRHREQEAAAAAVAQAPPVLLELFV